MNAYDLIRDDFSVLAFSHGISLLAQVNPASINLTIEPVPGTSTKATINFIVEELRLSQQEADSESKRLSALFDSMPVSLITSRLREGLSMHSVDRPIQVVAMNARVFLINPGEDRQEVLQPTTSTLSNNELQVGDDGVSGRGVFIVLWAVFASNILSWF